MISAYVVVNNKIKRIVATEAISMIETIIFVLPDGTTEEHTTRDVLTIHGNLS